MIDQKMIDQVMEKVTEQERWAGEDGTTQFYPGRWSEDAQATLKIGLQTLARENDIDDPSVVLGMSNVDLGGKVLDAIRDHTPHDWGRSEGARWAIGAGLKKAIEEALVSPNVGAGPRRYRSTWPTPPISLRENHQMELDRLQEWAENPFADLHGTVDEQFTALRRSWVALDGDTCWTTGEAKDFLGQVMDYKRHNLRRNEPGRENFEVGAKCRVVSRYVNSTNFDTSHTLVVKPGRSENLERSSSGLNVEHGYIYVVREDRPDVWGWMRTEHLVLNEDVVAEPEAAPPSEVEQLRQALAEAERKHREDIATIGQVLLREAENRSWCNEYDQVVEGLNRNLYVELEERSAEFDVTWTEVYSVTVERSARVTARDLDDAVEYVQENDYVGQATDDDLIEAIRYHTSGSYEECEDFSAERV